ncbi:unnamed protein product [Prorocentrum cordatum]|uniref:Peptidase A2 domain-containing protein n=1 Tax=Prorocentrum cordatum TaxID=2364126 RepID=A0ABN9S9J7_9DINO|nr:unnamed protein product [Polarella glacialis]
MRQGMSAFIEGRVAESIDLFDASSKAGYPQDDALWQRGLSLYYVDRFQEGGQAVPRRRGKEPERYRGESIWAMLCEARIVGFEQARKQMLTVGYDRRSVMRRVYKLYRGEDEAESLAFLQKALYLGLFAEARGDPAEARRLDSIEKGGKATESKPPPWRSDSEDGKETKDIKERLGHWRKTARFATHAEDRTLAEAQVERLQKALQEAKPLHVQQMSVNTRLAKAKETAGTLETNLEEKRQEVEKAKADLDKQLADAQLALDESRRQAGVLQQETREAYAKGFAQDGEQILKIGEPQFASASQEFKDWFSKLRADEAGGKRLEPCGRCLRPRPCSSRRPRARLGSLRAVASMFGLVLMMAIWSSANKPRSTSLLQERPSMRPNVLLKVMPAMKKQHFRLQQQGEFCVNSLPQYVVYSCNCSDLVSGSGHQLWFEYGCCGADDMLLSRSHVALDRLIDQIGIRTSVVTWTTHARPHWEKEVVSLAVRSWRFLNVLMTFHGVMTSPLMESAALRLRHSSRKVSRVYRLLAPPPLQLQIVGGRLASMSRCPCSLMRPKVFQMRWIDKAVATGYANGDYMAALAKVHQRLRSAPSPGGEVALSRPGSAPDVEGAGGAGGPREARHRRAWRPEVVCAGLLVCTLLSAAATFSAPYVVLLQVDGEPYALLLDTGSSNTILASSACAESCDVGPQWPMRTAPGDAPGVFTMVYGTGSADAVVATAELSLGGLTVQRGTLSSIIRQHAGIDGATLFPPPSDFLCYKYVRGAPGPGVPGSGRGASGRGRERDRERHLRHAAGPARGRGGDAQRLRHRAVRQVSSAVRATAGHEHLATVPAVRRRRHRGEPLPRGLPCFVFYALRHWQGT